MPYRIITHGGCTDGFCSAFAFLRYFSKQLPIEDIEILPAQPQDIQAAKIQFRKTDIVLDLPRPQQNVFFWCDHHLTQKPASPLPKNHYWKQAPSCTGYLIELAIGQGLSSTPALLEFKQVMDTIDAAEYSKEEVKECFYPQKSYEKSSSLLKMFMISAMFHTKDRILNDEIFKTLLSLKLEATPLEMPAILQLNPLMFHKALLQGYQLWRKQLDAYVYYDKAAQCIVQDDRKIKFSKGAPDRHYVYFKYPDAAYAISFRPTEEEEIRVGLGCNIFHKERCKVNIGALCAEVGTKFGSGSGGGHYTVGGATIKPAKADEALKYIMEKLKNKTM